VFHREVSYRIGDGLNRLKYFPLQKKSMRAIILLLLMSNSLLAQQTFQLSLETPPAKLSLLGESNISTSVNERDFVISPDGSEIYYTISTPKSTFQTIVVCKNMGNGKWSQPEIAPFAGEFSDLEPAISADGKTLFFASNRPVSGTEPKDFDIWKVERNGSGWGKPVNLGTTVNTEADEFYPSITKNGNLYFTAQYKGGVGREDIYVAEWKNMQYQKAVVLDTAVNSKAYEFNAFVSPDERFIIFTSYGRKDDSGGGDLYMSVKDAQGKWQPAKNLTALNSKQLDYCPYVSPNGKALFFTSERHQLPVSFQAGKASVKAIKEIVASPLNGTGNIYWIKFSSVTDSIK
jgi:WD40-like Beta Propeller Repeat